MTGKVNLSVAEWRDLAQLIRDIQEKLHKAAGLIEGRVGVDLHRQMQDLRIQQFPRMRSSLEHEMFKQHPQRSNLSYHIFLVGASDPGEAEIEGGP